MGQKGDAGKDFQRRGHQPLNTGYSPRDHRANSPHGNDLPRAPAGRTGESPPRGNPDRPKD